MADNDFSKDINDYGEGMEEVSEPITLIDDEGVMHQFELLDAIETDDARYCALLPCIEGDEEASEYYILQIVEVDGEEELCEVEDDELLDTLAEIFEKRFEEIYGYYEDEDDSESAE